jgi:hypothetical protein
VETIEEDFRETPAEFERLAGVLSRADAEMVATLGRLQELRQELGVLVASRLQRAWSGEEFARYLAVTADERRAHRHYLAARDWYEAALRQLRSSQPSRPRTI